MNENEQTQETITESEAPMPTIEQTTSEPETEVTNPDSKTVIVILVVAVVVLIVIMKLLFPALSQGTAGPSTLLK